jgi:hypothetical protein
LKRGTNKGVITLRVLSAGFHCAATVNFVAVLKADWSISFSKHWSFFRAFAFRSLLLASHAKYISFSVTFLRVCGQSKTPQTFMPLSHHRLVPHHINTHLLQISLLSSLRFRESVCEARVTSTTLEQIPFNKFSHIGLSVSRD